MVTNLGLALPHIDVTPRKLLDHLQVLRRAVQYKGPNVLCDWPIRQIPQRLDLSFLDFRVAVRRDVSDHGFMGEYREQTDTSSYGTSHRFGRSVTKAMDPEVFHETAERVMASRGFRHWRKSS